MPQAKKSKSGKSGAGKRVLGKGKMKGTKGGIIAVLIGKSSTTNLKSSPANAALLPAVQTGFCDGSV